MQETTVVGKDAEKGKPSCTLAGMQTVVATVENSMEVSQSIKNRTAKDPVFLPLGI